MSAISHIVRTGLSVLLLAGTLVSAAMADPFTVTGIRIDATANNSADAQRIAMANGQVEAAEILISRLTLAEDLYDSLLPVLDSEMASGLISGLDISNERRSSTRYIADLSVSFDRRAIRSLFRSYNLPYVETPQPTMLVIPVDQSSGQSVILEGPWHELWASGRYEHGLTPAIGLGQFEDNGEPLGADLIDVQTAMQMDEVALNELATLYGVERVAVVAGRSNNSGASATGQIVDFSTGEAVYTRLPTASGQSFRVAADRMIEELGQAWKERSIVRATDLTELQITVLHRNIQDWRALQTAIAGASLVNNAQLDALSVDGAVMTLTYRGDLNQLANELNARGAQLVEYEDLGWTVQSGR